MAFPRRGGRRDRDADFVAFYGARAGYLRRTAFALCGDWHLAEDLTQTTFTKLYQAWHRLDRYDQLEGYARQVLVRTFLDEGRRPWRREFSTAPESPVLDGAALDDHRAEERHVLLKALARIPNRRRAVLVLRYWADLPADEIAQILGCSSGTVRSQASRGLDDLREALGQSLHDLRLPMGGGTG